MLRLKENTTHPRQYIVIDEVHKGAKEERHLRAWGLRGKMPVLEEDFDRGFTKRNTMIGAAHINGFVANACTFVERDDNVVITSRYNNFPVS